jgi:hypothetical protein
MKGRYSSCAALMTFWPLRLTTQPCCQKNVSGYPNDVDEIKRHLDCAVFENLHAWRESTGVEGYDSVRSPFQEGRLLYPGGGFHEKTHIQICVRDPICIKGFFGLAMKTAMSSRSKPHIWPSAKC